MGKFVYRCPWVFLSCRPTHFPSPCHGVNLPAMYLMLTRRFVAVISTPPMLSQFQLPRHNEIQYAVWLYFRTAALLYLDYQADAKSHGCRWVSSKPFRHAATAELAIKSDLMKPWIQITTMKTSIAIPDFPSSLWSTVRSVGAFNVACSFAALWAFVKVIRVLRWRFKTTQLRGPPRTSFIYGVSNDLVSSKDSATMYEHWVQEYGVAYMIPSVLGQTRIVLSDPRAIAHFYARESWTYVQTPLSLTLIENLVC